MRWSVKDPKALPTHLDGVFEREKATFGATAGPRPKVRMLLRRSSSGAPGGALPAASNAQAKAALQQVDFGFIDVLSFGGSWKQWRFRWHPAGCLKRPGKVVLQQSNLSIGSWSYKQLSAPPAVPWQLPQTPRQSSPAVTGGHVTHEAQPAGRGEMQHLSGNLGGALSAAANAQAEAALRWGTLIVNRS